ncbi:hypothetical protein D3C71_2056440 [compost metagenome]
MQTEELNNVANTVNQRLSGGQFLEAGAVADVILFQLGNGARNVIGQDWVVDSGYTIR